MTDERDVYTGNPKSLTINMQKQVIIDAWEKIPQSMLFKISNLVTDHVIYVFKTTAAPF